MRDLKAIRIDGVNLDTEALADFLEKMDAAAAKGEEVYDRRLAERHPYRRSDLLVRLTEPDITLVVASRNLSSSGFSFLYRQMLYPGTRCVVELAAGKRTPNEAAPEPVETQGRVVSCRHVRGILHEVGVRFDKELDEERLAGLVGKRVTRSSDEQAKA